MKLRIKESGIGKKWCGDEIIILSENLSQAKLKKLLKANCEFVEEYEQETTSEETKTKKSKKGSTAKEENIGDDNSGRQADSREAAEE